MQKRIEEAFGRFQPSVGTKRTVEDGYIDLLGPRDPIGPSFAQKMIGRGQLVAARKEGDGDARGR